ncbi:hypothetical protein FCV25MIE_27167 [Fagus crenata]
MVRSVGWLRSFDSGVRIAGSNYCWFAAKMASIYLMEALGNDEPLKTKLIEKSKNESHEVGLDFLCAEQMLWMTHVLALIIYMDLYIIWSKDGHSHFVSGPRRGFVKATNDLMAIAGEALKSNITAVPVAID